MRKKSPVHATADEEDRAFKDHEKSAMFMQVTLDKFFKAMMTREKEVPDGNRRKYLKT